MGTITDPPKRIDALDCAKGMLVLLMVLYHWIDYFIGIHYEPMRYLRFVTPSFILLAGFLISHFYIVKYDLNETLVAKRLALRGLKIIGIFLLLNASIIMIFTPLSLKNAEGYRLLQVLVDVFIWGNVVQNGMGKVASFFVLVPIGYLLFLSAGLLSIQRLLFRSTPKRIRTAHSSFEYAPMERIERTKWLFATTLAMCLAAILCFYIQEAESNTLELLAIGLLGVMLGFVPFDYICCFSNHPYRLFVLYTVYLGTISVWNVTFPLQIMGVCLSVIVLLVIGTRCNSNKAVCGYLLLLGRYSLFGYIAQVVLIYALSRVLLPMDLGAIQLAASLLLTVTITVVSVTWVDHARRMSTIFNKLYQGVFA